jgi:uncharacterized protein (DUF58 family)
MSVAAALRQRIFRWRSDGTGTIRLGQRRVFILPTRAGLLFAMTLIAMLTGAINYGLALGHALVFLLVGLALVGKVHAFRNLHGLSITPGRCEPVFAGENAHFPLLFENDRNRPRPALVLAAGTGGPAVSLDIGPRALSRIDLPVATSRRGWLDLPRVRLETTYPLGLFVAWSYLQPAMRCLVYPRPLVSDLPEPGAASATGERHGSSGQEDFAGFRTRQPADSPRHVAWKAVARDDGTRPLLVKRFAGGASEEIRFEWAMVSANLDDETRIAILAGWVVAADAAGFRYGLSLPGIDILAGEGAAHRHRCLEALALLPG